MALAEAMRGAGVAELQYNRLAAGFGQEQGDQGMAKDKNLPIEI